MTFLHELARLAATIDAWQRLHAISLAPGDRLAVARLIAMLPSALLRDELRAVDASHAERGGVGAGARPAEGADVYLRAMVLRTIGALGS